MQPRTEEFLNLLLWTADTLMRPTFRNMTESYEGWAYRNGITRRVGILEQRKLIERDPGQPNDRVYRLTQEGRVHALGGRDPVAQWSRDWDGRWRMILFDLPVARNSERTHLRRYLRSRGFGCLQRSVWITPDSLEEERTYLSGGGINVESLLLLEMRPCAGESDAEIVAGAWDFAAIDREYSRYLDVLDTYPPGGPTDPIAAEALLRWAKEERQAWLAAVTPDPLLPERILPEGYLGKKAWQRRVEVLGEAARQLPAHQP